MCNRFSLPPMQMRAVSHHGAHSLLSVEARILWANAVSQGTPGLTLWARIQPQCSGPALPCVAGVPCSPTSSLPALATQKSCVKNWGAASGTCPCLSGFVLCLLSQIKLGRSCVCRTLLKLELYWLPRLPMGSLTPHTHQPCQKIE